MRILKYLALGVLAIITLMVARTLYFVPSAAPVPLQLPSLDAAETKRIADNLSKAITYRTISHGLDVAPDDAAFLGFHQFLEDTYPNAHRVMEKSTVETYSLMYRWPAAPGASKKPIAFMGHMDVVPVPERGADAWAHDPFAGVIDEAGIIWGRGTLDDKGMLIGLMEAVERLAASGFTPDRDIYFLFGHDEELGGPKGAAVMAGMLEEQGIQLAWVLDEGSAIVEDAMSGVQSPVALISLGEKGGVILKFSAEDEGGHSSAPKPFTAASLVARAGHLVTDTPYPLVLDEHLEALLTSVAPEMDFGKRIAIANLWATRPLLRDQLAKSATVAAFMHTTTAVTLMQGGTKNNVLPQYGELIVNYRIHPRDTVAGVMARAREIIGDDRVKIENLGGRDASPMSSVDGEGFRMIAESIRDTFGPIPIAPTLTVGGTDARYFYAVADDVYRFMPVSLVPSDLQRMHGTNEAIHQDALAAQVVFFKNLIRKAAE